jgi:hypothetical protein
MHPVVLAGLALSTSSLRHVDGLARRRACPYAPGHRRGPVGPDLAFQGGLATAALGLGLHFFIAFTAAAVFYAASRKLPTLQRHGLIWGAL